MELIAFYFTINFALLLLNIFIIHNFVFAYFNNRLIIIIQKQHRDEYITSFNFFLNFS